jgi:hypothetical protein
MPFITNGIIGANFDDETSDAKFAVGTIATCNDGSEWMYVKAGTACTIYDTVHINSSFSANPITPALAITGGRIGFAQRAFTLDYYGWVMLRGHPRIRVGLLCQEARPLYTTDTAGVLDDATVSASQHQVMGVIATDSVSASESVSTAVASFPVIRRPSA